MVNTEDFVGRLEKIMDFYKVSASAFADKIGVQRSSVSHVLTGRNKPSLEFVMKVVRSYPEVNLYWLLNGKGDFPQQQSEHMVGASPEVAGSHDPTSPKKIRKVIVLYDDGSFEAYDK